MLLAKAIALFVFLAVLELVAVPAFALLLLGAAARAALPELLLVLALADIAYRGDRHARRGARGPDAARATCSGRCWRCRCCVPIVIGAARATLPLLVVRIRGVGAAGALAG